MEGFKKWCLGDLRAQLLPGFGKNGVAVILLGITVKRDLNFSSDFSSFNNKI